MVVASLSGAMLSGFEQFKKTDLKVNDDDIPCCAAHLPQEGNQVLGPGWIILDTDCTEELNQGLHRVTGMDVVGPLVLKQNGKRIKKHGEEKAVWMDGDSFHFAT